MCSRLELYEQAAGRYDTEGTTGLAWMLEHLSRYHLCSAVASVLVLLTHRREHGCAFEVLHALRLLKSGCHSQRDFVSDEKGHQKNNSCAHVS